MRGKIYSGPVELRIFSCERPVFAGEVQAVFAKTPLGWFGILPHHAPAVFLLRDSPVRVKLAEGEKLFHVKGGVLRVRENRVTIVAAEVRHA
ncbi:MAG: hypothetical protein NZ651_00410 [Candidatus Bipolaricaulota bacterium]|nr:hypothetical protein [Candidatus Bipolaricaulota bacterium]MDW8126233.1 hypothetical protein [Candidatus Bipolaricaulota bacterium]